MTTADIQMLRLQQSQTNKLLKEQNALIQHTVEQNRAPIQCSKCSSSFHPSFINYCSKCKKTICQNDTYSGCCISCFSQHFTKTCYYNQHSIQREEKCPTCLKTFCAKHFYTYGSQQSLDECSDRPSYPVPVTYGNCMNCHVKSKNQGDCYICQIPSSYKYYYVCSQCNQTFCTHCRSTKMDINNNRFQRDNFCKKCESWSCVVL